MDEMSLETFKVTYAYMCICIFTGKFMYIHIYNVDL